MAARQVSSIFRLMTLLPIIRPIKNSKYLRPQDAAHHIGVSKRQLETWAKEEKVTPPQKIGRKVALYHRATLLADIQRLCGVHGPPGFSERGRAMTLLLENGLEQRPMTAPSLPTSQAEPCRLRGKMTPNGYEPENKAWLDVLTYPDASLGKRADGSPRRAGRNPMNIPLDVLTASGHPPRRIRELVRALCNPRGLQKGNETGDPVERLAYSQVSRYPGLLR